MDHADASRMHRWMRGWHRWTTGAWVVCVRVVVGLRMERVRETAPLRRSCRARMASKVRRRIASSWWDGEYSFASHGNFRLVVV